MSNKQYFGSEAREVLKRGIDKVFKATAPTMGAGGRNVVYNKWSRVPILTNDGVSIAREIEPEDMGELQGANLIKQIAERTNDEAGDGTTGSIVIAHSIIEQGMELLDNDKSVNPMKLRREIKEASEKVLEILKESAHPVTTLEELENVASISVESTETGKTIAKAIYDAGDDGIVYVNDSTDVGVTIEKVEGYQFQQGMITPYLLKNIDRMETILENVAVFITELSLSFTKEFNAMIKSVVTNDTKNILVICDEIHPDVIKFAVMNMIKGNFNLMIVKKPMQKDYLEDISAVVGANAMTQSKGLVYPKVEYLGRCEKVVIKEKTTTIFGTDVKLVDYVSSLKSQLENAEDEIVKTKLQERIARLTGGVYMLNVGEKTEAEAKYLKMKVDDAVNATKAAKEEGVVAGGGMALYDISRRVFENKTQGASIVLKACTAPLEQIIKNSGEDYLDITGQIEALSLGTPGFDALNLKVVPDMIEAGIIDPVKVIRSAFANASSFAGLLLTTDALISPIPEKNTGLPN